MEMDKDELEKMTIKESKLLSEEACRSLLKKDSNLQRRPNPLECMGAKT